MSYRVLVVLTAALVCPTFASGACTRDTVPLSLPIQRLDERLQDLTRETGCFIQVDPAGASAVPQREPPEVPVCEGSLADHINTQGGRSSDP